MARIFYGLSLLIVILCCVEATKPKATRKSRRNRQNINSTDEDSGRSKDEWIAMSHEALKLACNNHHITATGSHHTLAERLFLFFNPPHNNRLQGAGQQSCTQTQPQPPPPPLQQEVANHSTGAESTNRPNDISTQHDISALIREEIQKYFSSVSANNTNQSHGQASSNTQDLNIGAGASASAVNIVDNSLSSHGIPVSFSSQALRCRNSSRPATSMPPLPQAVIDKIQNGEFVNFDLLLPNRAPVLNDEYTFKVMGGSSPSVSLQPNIRFPRGRNTIRCSVINWHLTQNFLGRLLMTTFIIGTLEVPLL